MPGVGGRMIIVLAVVSAIGRGQYLIDQFDTRSEQPCGGQLSAADLDGSGLPDVIIPNAGGTQLCVHIDPFVNHFLGGTPTALPQYAVGPGLHGRIGRVDPGPTHDFFLFAWNGAGYLYTLLGAGDGTFLTVPSPVVITSNVYNFRIGDVNGDGLDDLLSTNYSASGAVQVELRINNYPGWTLVWSLPWPSGTAPFLIDDFDGDGFGDLAHPDAIGSASVLRLGSASGVPGAASILPGAAGGPWASGDLDGDGFRDLVEGVVTTGGLAGIAVRWGDPAQPLSQQTPVNFTFSYGGGYQNVLIGDFDSDGLGDLLTIETLSAGCPPPTYGGCVYYGGAGRIIRGLGGRTFSSTPMTLFEFIPGPTFGLPHIPLVADWDADGDDDVYGWNWDGIHWFENRAIFGTGCPGSSGVPTISVGTATLGNAGFAIGLGNALANASAILGISVAPSNAAGCGLSIGVLPGQLLLPSGSLGFLPVGAGGTASLNLPIPAAMALHGVTLFAQWAVADPAGAFGFAGTGYALSPARTIILW